MVRIRIPAFFLAFLIIALAMAAPLRAEETPNDQLARFIFQPPPGEEIVYRIESSYENEIEGHTVRWRWSEEIALTFDGTEPPDLILGTYTIRAVKNIEGAERDPYYLIARAIEGETHPTKWLKYGAPGETDWTAVKARTLARLPDIADAETAATIARLLPQFPEDGVTAVNRPLWVTCIAFLRAFKIDGSITEARDLLLPAFYPVEKSLLRFYGVRLEGSEDYAFYWRIDADPKQASELLGGELKGLAAILPDSAGRRKAEQMINDAIAAGIETTELGTFIYDPTPGLMRSVKFDATMNVGTLKRATHFVITRVSPE